MRDQPRVIVATSGRRNGDAKRIDLRLLAEKDGRVWTELEVYEGIISRNVQVATPLRRAAALKDDRAHRFCQ